MENKKLQEQRESSLTLFHDEFDPFLLEKNNCLVSTKFDDKSGLEKIYHKLGSDLTLFVNQIDWY